MFSGVKKVCPYMVMTWLLCSLIKETLLFMVCKKRNNSEMVVSLVPRCFKPGPNKRHKLEQNSKR